MSKNPNHEKPCEYKTVATTGAASGIGRVRCRRLLSDVNCIYSELKASIYVKNSGCFVTGSTLQISYHQYFYFQPQEKSAPFCYHLSSNAAGLFSRNAAMPSPASLAPNTASQ